MFQIDSNKRMSIVQGDTAIFNVNIDNHTFVEGDKAYFTVRKNISDSPISIQKVITEFNGNSFKIFLNKDDTDIPVGNYLYDIQLSLLDGRVDTVILPTRFTVLGGVTVD